MSTLFATNPLRRSFLHTETQALRALLEERPLLTAEEIVARYRQITGDTEHTIAALYTEVGDLKRVIPSLPVTKTLLTQFSVLRRMEEGTLPVARTQRAPKAVLVVTAPQPRVTAPADDEAPAGFMSGAEVDEYLAEFPEDLRARCPLETAPFTRSNGTRTVVYSIPSVERAEAALRALQGRAALPTSLEPVRALLTNLDAGKATADEVMTGLRTFLAPVTA